MTQKLKTIIMVTYLVLATFLLASTAYADYPGDGSSSSTSTTSSSSSDIGNGCNGMTASTCLQQDPIVKDLNTIVDFLSAGVGVVVTAVIIVGGIQYSIAGDNPQAVTAARQRITNGLIALVVFLLTFSFLQWIIPGGVFS